MQMKKVLSKKLVTYLESRRRYHENLRDTSKVEETQRLHQGKINVLNEILTWVRQVEEWT